MSKELLSRIEKFKNKEKKTWFDVAKALDVPENYIYRWRKTNIKGTMEKYVNIKLKQLGY